MRYYTDATSEERENYYTGAVAQGEPPGRWYGAGAAKLGLSGLVKTQDMLGLYERFLDPRDPAFADPSRWDEVSVLGHTGYNYRTEEEIYQELLDAEPEADAARRDELRVQAGRQLGHNVAYLDATFSVAKSISVTQAAFEAQEIQARRAGNLDEAEAWGWLREAVENAIWAGNNAMLDYLSQNAGYSRTGHHGGEAGTWIDAHDWTVASFFQHDSRDHDPHLHIHNPIHNRVQCADGKWRTIDSKAVHAFKPAAAALGERVTEETLAASLGVLSAMRPDGKARELLGVPEKVCELLSSRKRAIGPRAAELMAAFEARKGRAPSPLERDQICQQAGKATRKSKGKGESTEQRLDRVERQVNEILGTGLGDVAHGVLAQSVKERPAPQAWSVREVIETALAAVQDKQSSWTVPQLTREISNALPDYLGIPDPEKIARLLDQLTARALELAVALDAPRPGDEAVAAQFQLANGQSSFVAPGRARYATPAQLHTERLLVSATIARDAAATTSACARAFVDRLAKTGITLGDDQAAVITGVLTSGARVETLVGPAGAGKSFVLGTLAHAWSDPRTWARPDQPDQPAPQPGRMVGLAATQRAAGVLEAEGISAANTPAWLAAQRRLSENRGLDGDRRWALRRADVVVIDESSMADTAQIGEVYRWVRAAGAKLLLVGDHKQLGAVGASGLAELLADRGRAYELTEVRRFTNQWERAASLRLRVGDASVLDEYHKNGRIIAGGSIEATEAIAARRWLADTLAGKQSILVVDSNEQAARINASLRARLVELGRVSEHGVLLGLDGTTAGVGDTVQARRVARELEGYAGNKRGPVNREQYRVLQTRDDGSVVVAPILAAGGAEGAERLGEAMTLPASYVAEDLTLGYAATVHAAESLTVDTDHCVATPDTAANALYPAATRGREANHIYVVTEYVRDPSEPDEAASAVSRNPRAVLATILETSEPERSATAWAGESAQQAASVRTAAERLAAVAEVAVAERTTQWLDELTDIGALTIAQRRRIAAEDGGRKLAPILRRVEIAGRDPRAALAEVVSGRSLDDALQVSNVLVHRLTHNRGFDPAGDSLSDWVPATDDPALAAMLGEIAATGDNRRRELGEQLAADPPEWAREALGEIPDDPEQRAGWVAKASIVAGHRELVDHDDPTDVLGPAPKPGQVEAYASWRAAWRALGRPDADRAERDMTDGQLRMRVRAYQREIPWAPRRVANELAGTIQAAEHHRETATLKTAEAEAVEDVQERERLAAEAEQATATADMLETRVEQLRELDEKWALWVAHTAATRAAADRAHAELAARHPTDPYAEDDRVTAEEWFAADEEATKADDPHRQITETDLADERELARAEHDRAEYQRAKAYVQPLDTLDIRQLAEDEQPGADEDTVRVPTAAEQADSVRRAERALAEIHAREAADPDHAAEQEAARVERVDRWQTDDQAELLAEDTEEHADGYGPTDGFGPAPVESTSAGQGADYA